MNGDAAHPYRVPMWHMGARGTRGTGAENNIFQNGMVCGLIMRNGKQQWMHDCSEQSTFSTIP
jgi:hypothetical protein